LLKHSYDGTLLHQGKSFETLKRLYKIWKKPVHIETVVGDQKKILSFNGEDISVKK
jgi:stage V sporulation protein R